MCPQDIQSIYVLQIMPLACSEIVDANNEEQEEYLNIKITRNRSEQIKRVVLSGYFSINRL